MGLYSINRLTNMGFSSLVESAKNIELEESTIEEAPLSLFETMQYIQEEEQKMFDTVIAADFEELFKQSGLNTTVHEADENNSNDKKEEDKDKEKKSDGEQNLAQKIWAKIKEIAGKVKNAVIGAFNAITRKLEELFKADEKIIAKYKPAIEKCKDFNGFKFDECEIALNLEQDVVNKIIPALTSIKDTIAAGGDNVSEDVTKKLNETTENVEKLVKEAFKKYTTLSKDQILKLIEILNPSKAKATFLEKLSSGTITVSKKIEEEANDSGDEKKAHAKYEKVKVSSQALVKMARLSIDAIRKNITTARRILILAGRFALNETKDDTTAEITSDKKKEEDKKESGKEESALIAMASDMYVTEMLAMD